MLLAQLYKSSNIPSMEGCCILAGSGSHRGAHHNLQENRVAGFDMVSGFNMVSGFDRVSGCNMFAGFNRVAGSNRVVEREP